MTWKLSWLNKVTAHINYSVFLMRSFWNMFQQLHESDSFSKAYLRFISFINLVINNCRIPALFQSVVSSASDTNEFAEATKVVQEARTHLT